jgi:hypothetical protein
MYFQIPSAPPHGTSSGLRTRGVWRCFPATSDYQGTGEMNRYIIGQYSEFVNTIGIYLRLK